MTPTDAHDGGQSGEFGRTDDAAGATAESRPKTDPGRLARLTAAALGGTLLALGLRRRSLGGAAAALAGGWLLYRGVGAAGGRGEPGVPDDAPAVERSVTVGASADELHELWRDPEHLADVWGHFAEVTPAGEDRQRWRLGGPLGRSVTWETRVVEDRPGEVLRWKSVEGAPVPNEGSVRFRPAPADRGTEVTLRLRFDPPGGPLGDAALSRLGVVPESVAGNALDRFKSLAETGEIPTLERNPSARGSGDLM